MKRFAWFGLVCIAGFSCDPKCNFKDLDKMSCFIMMAKGDYNSTTYSQDYYFKYKTPLKQIFIINDDSTYQANYGPKHKFGNIDFALNSIIGVTINTNPARGLLSQGYLCKSLAANSWTYTVEYTLNNQCAGSHISSMNFTASLVCPKMQPNADITLIAKDINPF